jgi:hypothetical protein
MVVVEVENRGEGSTSGYGMAEDRFFGVFLGRMGCLLDKADGV